MGTRAQFFVGDPRDLEAREWLGTVAFDGYPDGDVGELLRPARTEQQFRDQVALIAAKRDDFCDPSANDFPFPWTDDLFLTDYTYAWFDAAVQLTSFHTGFIPLKNYSEEYHDRPDELPENVPAPTHKGLPRGPDSIIIITAR